MEAIVWKSLLLLMVLAVGLLEVESGVYHDSHKNYRPRRRGGFRALTSSSSSSSSSSSGSSRHFRGRRHHDSSSEEQSSSEERDSGESSEENASGERWQARRRHGGKARGVRFVAYSARSARRSKEPRRQLYEPAPSSATVGLLQGHPHGKPKRPIFCYYGASANTRPGVGKFFPENIDPFLCTHLIFAFVNVNEDGTGLIPNNIDDLTDEGLYKRTVALKKKNPELKVLLGVGGWKIGSKPFLPVIKSRSTWKYWISNVIQYLRKYNFDGFDMDWEFPGWRGSGPEDQHKFTLLLKDLQAGFMEEAAETGKPKLLLTLATASSVFYIEKSYEPAEIHKHIDYMLLMTYNYHGSGWEKHTGHHSPIMPHPLDPEGEQRELYVLWSIKYWLQFGVPKEKLIVGIPTYGLGWKLEDPSQTGIRAPADGGNTQGKYTGEQGILSHFEICEHIIHDGWQVKWIDSQKVPYAYGDGEWVGFESPDSIYIKAMTIIKEGLGGAFIWSVEMDDFSGHCGGPKYPLLRTVYEVFSKASLSASLTAPASHNGYSSEAASTEVSGGHDNSHGASSSDYGGHTEDSDYGSYDNEDYGSHGSSSSQDYYSGSSSDYRGDYEYSDERSYEEGKDYEYDDERSYEEVSVDCHELGLGIHADPSSCHHFVLCMPSASSSVRVSRMPCPEGTMYDKTLKVCNHEHAVSCGD